MTKVTAPNGRVSPSARSSAVLHGPDDERTRGPLFKRIVELDRLVELQPDEAGLNREAEHEVDEQSAVRLRRAILRSERSSLEQEFEWKIERESDLAAEEEHRRQAIHLGLRQAFRLTAAAIAIVAVAAIGLVLSGLLESGATPTYGPVSPIAPQLEQWVSTILYIFR